MNRIFNFERLIPILFAVSVFSLIWRAGFPKPFELLLGLTILLAVWHFALDRETSISNWGLIALRKYGILMAVILTSAIVGILYSVSVFEEVLSHRTEIYLEYARVIFVFILFFFTIYVINRYRDSLKLSLGAIVVAPVVLIAAFAPWWRDFFVDNARLIGAKNDPNYLATFIAMGLIISWTYFLYTNSHKKWLGIFAMSFNIPLLLWTGSRSAFLSIALAYILLLSLYLSSKFSSLKARKALTLFGILILFLIFSYFILPSDSLTSLYERAPSSRTTVSEFTYDGFDYSRGRLWSEGYSKSLRAPLGFGFAYHNWNPIGDIGRPHNLWLEVALSSGWVGLSSFIIILVFVVKNILSLLKDRNFVTVSLAVGFVYLLISGLFLDMFTLRWLWLIMGMIVGYSFLKSDEKTKSISTPPNL